MNENIDERQAESTTKMSASRREFLQATGMATFATVAANTATGLSAAEPSFAPETAAGPGRVENLTDYITDPALFEQHTEPTHVTAAVPYGSVEAALEADEPFTKLETRFAESEYVELLDGEWDFRFYTHPASRPDRYDGVEGWENIDVPGVWQTQGYDQLIYQNTTITWEGYDPKLDGNLDPRYDIEIPDTNPTGTYRKTVEVPSNWNGRKVFLHFGAVKQAYFVWVDDEYVGFHEGSMTPGEFDITDSITPGGEHELTVQAYRFSDGEAMETQDMFRFSGIHRSVYLFATPEVHLRDFYARSGLDDEYEDGRLRIEGEIANYGDTPAGRYTVRAHLYDPDGRRVTTLRDSVPVGADGATVTLETDVRTPDQWSAEHPNLYSLGLELVRHGVTTEAMLDKVGFRTFETTRGQPGAQVLVNGEAVNVRGVNRPESDPKTGRTVRLETVTKDMELMKQNNINAIRNSHYPNAPTFYRLADEYGIYVADEVNVETHWWEGLAANTEAYHDAMVERFRRMVLRDRNHASIFAWSTGNEAGTGNEHINMAALAMDSDEYLPEDTSEVSGVGTVESYDGPVYGLAPDRLVYHQPNGGGWNIEYSDMLGPRYPDVDGLLAVADGSSIGDGNRPVVMGEYNHAMGNSLGLVHAMWSEHIQPPVRRARDETGNGNDGVLVGTPTVEIGETGGAVTLDSGDDSIEIASSSSLDFDVPGFTLGAAVDGIDPRTERTLVSKGDEYALTVERGGKLGFHVHGEEWSSVTAHVSSNLSDGWHSFVAVCTVDELVLYLDGERLADADHDITEIPENGAPIVIGGEGDGRRHGHHGHHGHHHGHEGRQGEHHHGRDGRGRHDGRHDHGNHHDHDGRHGRRGGSATLDSVRVFDRPLSADEVSGGIDSVENGAVLGYSFADLLRDESLQGGFIWAWEDQAVTRTTTVDGEAVEYTFYDGNPFCLNGLVWADRSVQPDVPQLKHSHQPVKIAPTDATSDGAIYVTNHFTFTDLRAVMGRWQLVEDDDVLQSGHLDLDSSPGETRRVRLPIEEPRHLDPGAEYRLDVSFSLEESTPYADAGHVVARDQLDVPFDVPETPSVDVGDLPALSVDEGSDAVTVSGDGFEYVLDRDVGTFTSMNYGDVDVVDRGPLFNAWRAPIMNEVQAWGSEQASSWRAAGLDDLTQLVDDVSVTRPADAHVQVDVDGFVQGAPPRTVRKTPDASTTGSDGTLMGDPDVVSGNRGSAVRFDGDGDYVDAGSPSGLDFTSPGFTVSVTFRGVESGGHHPFVSKGDHQYALKVNGDRFSFFIYDGTWITVNDTIPSDLNDGWHTLTGVCAEDELRLYLDGELFASRNHDATSVNGTDQPVHIAHNAERSGRYTDTTVDSVRIYDRPLSADEVTTQPESPPDDAVLWYGFDEFYDSTSSARGHGFETTYRYHVFGSGDVVMDVAAAPNDEMKATVQDYLPKMGLQLKAPTALSSFEWYGRGPVETYPDRRWGADIGRYSGTVGEQYVPYVPPTDNGNKAETRWAALSNGDGAGLLGVATDESINVSLNQYANLAEAGHQYELEESDSVEFNLDDAVTGVGGTPVEPLDEYQIHTVPTSFSVLLRPFTADDGDLMALANRSFPVGESSDDST